MDRLSKTLHSTHLELNTFNPKIKKTKNELKMLKIINIEGTKVKEGNLYSISYSDMVALNQSKNHAANKGKTAGRYQFDTHPFHLIELYQF